MLFIVCVTEYSSLALNNIELIWKILEKNAQKYFWNTNTLPSVFFWEILILVGILRVLFWPILLLILRVFFGIRKQPCLFVPFLVTDSTWIFVPVYG